MRLFIAVPLNDEFFGLTDTVSKELDFPGLRKVSCENIHLTISFLGERDDAEKIRERLRTIKFERFILKTKSMGFFPSNSRIRVVWFGLEENPLFMKLQQSVRSMFDHKEKFMPHVTFLRASHLIADKEEKIMKKVGIIKYAEIDIPVKKFVLYKSKLTPKGPIHEVIEEYF